MFNKRDECLARVFSLVGGVLEVLRENEGQHRLTNPLEDISWKKGSSPHPLPLNPVYELIGTFSLQNKIIGLKS